MRQWWKMILEYAAGILSLAAVIALAWFLPGWYAGWQDAKSLGRPSVSAREEIRFLDAEALDIASRLKMLEDSETRFWEFAGFHDSFDNETNMAKCRKMTERFEECGLVPAGLSECVREDCLWYSGDLYVREEGNYQMRLPVTALVFAESVRTGGGSYDMGRYENSKTDAPDLLLTVLMDAEKELFYYISFLGGDERIYEYLTESTGYSSTAELADALDTDAFVLKDDYSRYDFAGVCRAADASVSSQEGLNLNVGLHYETFDAHAYRRLVESDNFTGFPMYGFAVMFGSEWWNDCVIQLENTIGLPFVYPLSEEDSYIFVKQLAGEATEAESGEQIVAGADGAAASAEQFGVSEASDGGGAKVFVENSDGIP